MEEKLISKVVRTMYNIEYDFLWDADENLREHLHMTEKEFYTDGFQGIVNKAYDIYQKGLNIN